MLELSFSKNDFLPRLVSAIYLCTVGLILLQACFPFPFVVVYLLELTVIGEFCLPGMEDPQIWDKVVEGLTWVCYRRR